MLIMLLGPPSFLAPGKSSLLLLFINFADEDPECEDADEGVLNALPPLANTLRIGRTTLVGNSQNVNISRILMCEQCTMQGQIVTLPAGALYVLCEAAAELGLFLRARKT